MGAGEEEGADASWVLVLLQAYFLGGVLNHGLALAIHDIAHNTAFGNDRPVTVRAESLYRWIFEVGTMSDCIFRCGE